MITPERLAEIERGAHNAGRLDVHELIAEVRRLRGVLEEIGDMNACSAEDNAACTARMAIGEAGTDRSHEPGEQCPDCRVPDRRWSYCECPPPPTPPSAPVA